jgi:Caspase domain
MSKTTRSIGSTDHLSSLPEQGGRSFIFAIGINDYQHFAPLEYAATDVQELVHVLTERYQFNQADVKLLVNGDATRSNIHKYFRHLAQTIKEADSLLVLFSGHGTYDKVLDKGYWIPVDARPEDTGSYIANIEISGFLESIRSLHTLVISDSCFSGKLFGRTRFVPRADLLESTPSRWMMTSGRAELVPDKSKFAESLATYLEKNKQPELRFNDVFHSIYSAVVNNSWQTPRYEPLQNVGHEGGEFILRFKDYEAPSGLTDQYKLNSAVPEPTVSGEMSPAPERVERGKSMLEKPGVQIGIAAASIAITALLLAMLFPGWFGLKKPGALSVPGKTPRLNLRCKTRATQQHSCGRSLAPARTFRF